LYRIVSYRIDCTVLQGLAVRQVRPGSKARPVQTDFPVMLVHPGRPGHLERLAPRASWVSVDRLEVVDLTAQPEQAELPAPLVLSARLDQRVISGPLELTAILDLQVIFAPTGNANSNRNKENIFLHFAHLVINIGAIQGITLVEVYLFIYLFTTKGQNRPLTCQ